jgi:Mg2+ and Co2+ transporter CorA
MTDKERLQQLELIVSEMIIKQDRTLEEISDLKTRVVKVENKLDTQNTSLLQIAKGVIQQSDNIEYLINKQSQTEEKLTDIQQTLKLILAKLDK